MQNYSSHSTDAELLEGCRQKHRLAQKHLYQRFYPRVMGIAMRYTGHKQEATDVLNQAFLKVFNKIDTYSENSLSGWIATIVTHTAIDFVRKHARYKKRMDFDSEKEVVLNEQSLENLYVEDLLKEVQQLPANSRAVFSMYAIDGYKHREIAEILKININTSKWHLAEAKKILKKRLERQTSTVKKKQIFVHLNLFNPLDGI